KAAAIDDRLEVSVTGNHGPTLPRSHASGKRRLARTQAHDATLPRPPLQPLQSAGPLVAGDHISQERLMSKGMDRNKETKKRPATAVMDEKAEQHANKTDRRPRRAYEIRVHAAPCAQDIRSGDDVGVPGPTVAGFDARERAGGPLDFVQEIQRHATPRGPLRD